VRSGARLASDRRRVFVLPGIGLLVVFILARPQEFFPLLQKVPFLHIGAALAAIGYVVDVRLHRLQPVPNNTLPWVLALLGWSVVSTAVNAPETLPRLALEMAILFVLYGTIAHGIQRLRTLQFTAGVLATTCMFIALVCFHQGISPRQCVGGQAIVGGVDGKPDGRPCELYMQCVGPDAEPGLDYRCEKVGLFDKYSVDGRVRYMGELHDPNEVALTLCAGGIGLLIGFALRTRRSGAHLLLGLGVALLLATVLLTRSRGGLVAAMLVPGVYVIRRWGLVALLPVAFIAIPVLVLGGRAGSAVSASTMLRYEAWATGLDMFERHPLFGVGTRRFSDHHFLTAHNSYVLTLAELGFVGMVLFMALVYLSIKTLVVGLREVGRIPGTAAAQVWGMALLSAMIGITFQINTLSFAYHSVLWLFFGLVGAWYSAVRHHLPALDIRIKLLDFLAVIALCVGYAFVALPVFLTYQGMR
jgi:O-antigen ligase